MLQESTSRAFNTKASASVSVKPIQVNNVSFSEPQEIPEPTFPQEISNYINVNREYLPEDKIGAINSKLLLMEDNWFVVNDIRFKDPKKSKYLQLLGIIGLGGIGRFYCGDYIVGVLQFLFPYIGPFWSIIDFFIIEKKVKDINYCKIQKLI